MGCKGSKAAASDKAAKKAFLEDPEDTTEEKADDAAPPKEVEETTAGQAVTDPATDEAQPAVDHPKDGLAGNAELVYLQAELERTRHRASTEDGAEESSTARTQVAAQVEPSREDTPQFGSVPTSFLSSQEAEAAETKDVENAPEVKAEAVVDELIKKETSFTGALSEISTSADSYQNAMSLALLEDGVRTIEEDTAAPKEVIGGGGCWLCCRAEKVKEMEKEKEKEEEKENEKQKEKEKEKHKDKEEVKAKAKPKSKAKAKGKAKAKAK